MNAAALQVLAERPISVPVVLLEATTMQQIADLEARIAGLKIVDAASAQEGANLKLTVARLDKQIEDARVAVKKPFLDMERAIDLAAKKPAARLSAMRSTVQTELNAYLAEQERIREAEERRRREEAARIERLRVEAEEKLRREQEAEARRVAEESKRIADEEARLAAAASDDMPVEIAEEDDEDLPPAPPSEAERTLAALNVQAATLAKAPVATVKPAGLRRCPVLLYDLEAIHRVPDELLRPRELDVGKVRALYVTGWKEGDPLPVVPGLKFRTETRYV
jgi:hypothetical protein